MILFGVPLQWSVAWPDTMVGSGAGLLVRYCPNKDGHVFVMLETQGSPIALQGYGETLADAIADVTKSLNKIEAGAVAFRRILEAGA